MIALLSSTLLPVRSDLELDLGLLWIIGLDGHLEQVLAVHPLMHHEFQRNGGGFTRSQSRLTDDDGGRSAPIDEGGHVRCFQA